MWFPLPDRVLKKTVSPEMIPAGTAVGTVVVVMVVVVVVIMVVAGIAASTHLLLIHHFDPRC